jgi:hypothetical protein
MSRTASLLYCALPGTRCVEAFTLIKALQLTEAAFAAEAVVVSRYQ